MDQRYHRLYLMVREFAERARPTTPAIRYRTRPDEALDLTLCAHRAYGDGMLWFAVQAAAGMDSPELPMPEQDLVLPPRELLIAMMVDAGFPADLGLL